MDRPSVVKRVRERSKRNLAKVPFVELVGGRVQGIVSSGSDIERVYCSFFDANGNYYCSTNNNRRCGGLGGPCKHIAELVEQAVQGFGADAVAATLKLDPAQIRGRGALYGRGGAETKEPAGVVFSRFLHDLHYVELPASDGPAPELTWFVTG